MEKKWWKEAVVYQIYPRSFMDSNGDGIGDIQGIISKLDYVKDLGINVIWVCPIYQSPNDDNGYDISDYKAISEDFGTMDDFEQLLEEVHRRDMKLIMDLVVNHTSDEHPWFVESRSSKNNPYRDYYIWRPGKNGKEPNNWGSIFGGSAWKYDKKTDEYYLHVFSTKQPDLNWENPKVRQDIYKMINWWLDKGIDGFRVDAISHIKKVRGLPDLPNPKKLDYVPSYKGHMNRKGIQSFLQELKKETFTKYDIMTVGEANGVSIKDAEGWVGKEKGIFNMIFQFEHLDLWGKGTDKGLDIHALKETLSKWQNGLNGVGWNALFLENHDQPRSVSTWGDDQDYREKSAKSLATMYFLMKGTPFIYQGQEIGMTNVQFPSIEDYDDVNSRNFYHSERKKGVQKEEIMEVIWKTSRDNSRTPMQWNDHTNAGFTTGTPWLKVHPKYKEINVARELKDKNSIYHYYKKLIQLRNEIPTLIYGSYELLLDNHDYIYSYTRTLENNLVLVLTNLFNVDADFNLPEELKVNKKELLLCNYEESGMEELTLRPYEARVYLLEI
ncbi:glycoside hydrolase family 13 protein [Oceanobacillus senegalensis]|uniref:glycoside hydrolase family 13 protein n=1 Tax=Oceanobacillus senegalensis TaxID=1936063 RepID=UPI000A30D631|nr:alpha-glucosidase [Oceanobacillus senegalensis]